MSQNYIYSPRTRKRRSKNKDMKLHLQKRFLQRFGIQLTRNLFEYILGQIHHNKSKHICNQSRTRAVHIVKVPIGDSTKEIVVIYNKNRKQIHTAFPVSWLTDGSYTEYLNRKAYINGEDCDE